MHGSLIQRLAIAVGPRQLHDALTEREREVLQHLWRAWARPEQIVPEGDWRIAIACGGRGGGKTRLAAEFVRQRVEQGRARYIHLVGKTAADVRDTMVEHGPSSLLKISRSDFRPVYEPSKRRLVWPNGAVAMMFSAEDPDALRGPQCDLAWADELAAWRRQRDTWDMLEFGLRLTGPRGDQPQCIVSTTPKPTDVMRELLLGIMQSDHSRVRRPDVLALPRSSTYANRANLDSGFLRSMMARYEGTRIGRQELLAELLEDVEGALWTLAMIEDARVPADSDEEYARLVVAIDPAVTNTAKSDETGIVAAGKRTRDGEIDVLADRSGRMSPAEWATRAVELYRELEADQIIAEVNNGGDLVKHTIRTVDPSVPVKQVRASRGKTLRAEPIAALYEQGRVHHVGCFPVLEDQLTTWVQGAKSPDRLDALVWAATDLAYTRKRGRRPAGPIAVEMH